MEKFVYLGFTGDFGKKCNREKNHFQSKERNVL